MVALELLAPARNADIGIAAIDCGADAVYIGGPLFGARAAAGNSIADIRRLCAHAALYGARIYVTVNTLLDNDSERQEALKMMLALKNCGVSAFIMQDASLIPLLRENGPWSESFHASTQCSIRTPERALELVGAGFSRLILERQLSLEQISAIRNAVPVECELEFFVHGALCVCYSGDCYLSQAITGRSANRGECAQPCRSRYDLRDGSGKLLAKDCEILSLKDLCLVDRLPDLAEAGVSSFKIEGRLKNESYVRNVVRAYSLALDNLISKSGGKYRRASFGTVRSSFEPQLGKSFNRGFTAAYIDGKRGPWHSEAAAKSMGEYVGRILEIRGSESFTLALEPGITLSNGDGLAAVPAKSGRKGGNIPVGFRADVVKALDQSCTLVRCKSTEALEKGDKVWRNFDSNFEKTVENSHPERLLSVHLDVTVEKAALQVCAEREDGFKFSLKADTQDFPEANDRQRMENLLRSSLDKTAGRCNFNTGRIICDGPMPLLPVSFVNSLRRNLAGISDASAVIPIKIAHRELSEDKIPTEHPRREGELMRSRYCIRYRMGLCPREAKLSKNPDAASANAKNGWSITNNGRTLRLDFDCKSCEMVVSLPFTIH